MIGSIGEFYVAYELSRLGIDVVIVGGNNRFGIADIVVNGNKTIEVKTSVYSQNRKGGGNGHVAKSGWGFAGLKKTNTHKSDYFAFVLLNNDMSTYNTIYVNNANIRSGSFWYWKPNNKTCMGKRGPSPTETTWKNHFMTAKEFAKLIMSQHEI